MLLIRFLLMFFIYFRIKNIWYFNFVFTVLLTNNKGMRVRFLQTVATFMLFATSIFAQFDSKTFDSQSELVPMAEQEQAGSVKGFAYCDRTVTKPRFLSGKDNIMLTGAILVPPMKDNRIKGVRFYANVADDKGCIFVADAESQEILEIKEVAIKPGLNDFSFDVPLTMKYETSYYVGFQQLAGAGEQSYVVPFDNRREYSLDPGAFVQRSKKRYEKSGYTSLMNVASLRIGTLMIYVDIEDVKGKMINMAYPLKTEVPEDATEEKPFDAVITVRNLGGNEIKSLNAGLLFGQNGQSGDLTCSIPAYSDGEIKATCESVAGGLGTCELTVQKVNGAFNPYRDYKALNQYRVIALTGGGVTRDNVLIEAFVSEKSEKSIEAEKGLMKICEEYKSQGLNPIFVTYHLDDEFTSKKIKSLIGDLNVSEYPVAAFNRLVNPKVEYSLDLPNAQPMEQWEVMKELATKADQPFTFDNVTVKKDGSITVHMTGTTYKYCDPRTLYVTALIVEKEVPAKAQVGAKEGYVHHNVVREFITLEYGNKLNPDEQMVELKSKPIPSLENQTKRDLDIVIILHQDITGIYPKQKTVYAAGVWTLNSTIGVEPVAPAYSPKISVLDGYLNIEGDVRDITIYTVDGQMVARSAAHQLTSGSYVVVFTSHNGYKSSAKVFVK